MKPYGYLRDIPGRLGTHPKKDIWELNNHPAGPSCVGAGWSGSKGG
jgi:hypothetical protein